MGMRHRDRRAAHVLRLLGLNLIFLGLGVFHQAHAQEDGTIPSSPDTWAENGVTCNYSRGCPAGGPLEFVVERGGDGGQHPAPNGDFSTMAGDFTGQGGYRFGPQPDEAGFISTPDCNKTTHPVILTSGAKVLQEFDFQTNQLFPLKLVRYYNTTSNGAISGFRTYWYTPFVDSQLDFYISGNIDCFHVIGNDAFNRAGAVPACKNYQTSGYFQKIVRLFGDGSTLTYVLQSDGTYRNPQPEVHDHIVQLGDGTWQVQNADGSTETYDRSGYIIASKGPTGVGLTFSYSNYLLQRVTHTSGLSIGFSWTIVSQQTNNISARISAVTDPAGNTYTYNYTPSDIGVLSGVTTPGPQPVTRNYLFEDTRFPTSITGIVINGVRYSHYFYDANRRVQSSGLGDDGSIEKLSFSYGTDSNGITTTITNAANAVTLNHYSANRLTESDLSGVTGCPNTTKTIHYDANNHADYSVDRRGIKTQYTYSPDGYLQDIVTGLDPNNPGQQRETKSVWDAAHDRLSSSTSLGPSGAPIAETDYIYYPDTDPAKNRLKTINVTNLTANGTPNQVIATNFSYQFYASGMPSKVVVDGPDGLVTSNYDTVGNLTSKVDGVGNATNFSGYNQLGLAATITDPNGYTVNYGYDAIGRKTSESRTLDGTTTTVTYQYDGMGHITRTDTPDGYLTASYDGAGRISLTSGSLSTQISRVTSTGCIQHATQTFTQSYQYDSLSKLTAEAINPITSSWVNGVNCGGSSGSSSASSFAQMAASGDVPIYSHSWVNDSVGRVLTDQGFNGQTTQYTYDPNGNLATKKDSYGHILNYTYSANDQVQTVSDQYQNVTRYSYDGLGNVASVTDPRGNTTTYIRDGFGHVTSQTSPDTHVTLYSYDSFGRLSQIVRADRTAITYNEYDRLNRYHSITAGNVTNTFTYDTCVNGKGQLCGVTDSSGSTSYAYRKNGQLTSQVSVIGGTSYTTNWAYDYLNRLATVTYPGGNVVSYGYDVLGRVVTMFATINGTSQTIAQNVSYLGPGPMNSIKWGNGLLTTSTYDRDFRLTALGTGGFDSHTYGYDLNNNVTSIGDSTNSANAETLSYEPVLTWLTSVSSSGLGNQSINLDAVGNRLSYSSSGVTDAYTSDPGSNRISSISGSHSRSFTYDSGGLGNLVGVSGWGGIRAYGYDSFNRLSSVTNSGVITNYAYNALGQRVSKSGGSTAGFLYSRDGTLLAEAPTAGGAINTQYVWIGQVLVAVIRNGALYFVHNDHLSRPDAVTNSAGTLVWKSQGTAFDRTVSINSFGGLNVGFPGQYLDAESGLYYNLNRYYDPGLGRYLQSDPIGLLAGINTYSYALNRPSMLFDPLGLWSAGGNLVIGGGAGVTLYGTGNLAAAIGSGDFSGITITGGSLQIAYGLSTALNYNPSGSLPGPSTPPGNVSIGLSGKIGIRASKLNLAVGDSCGITTNIDHNADLATLLTSQLFKPWNDFSPPSISGTTGGGFDFSIGYSFGIQVIGH